MRLYPVGSACLLYHVLMKMCVLWTANICGPCLKIPKAVWDYLNMRGNRKSDETFEKVWNCLPYHELERDFPGGAYAYISDVGDKFSLSAGIMENLTALNLRGAMGLWLKPQMNMIPWGKTIWHFTERLGSAMGRITMVGTFYPTMKKSASCAGRQGILPHSSLEMRKRIVIWDLCLRGSCPCPRLGLL